MASLRPGSHQGCQMKISIKIQTMLKNARKRPNRLFKVHKKQPNLICGIVIPLSQKTSKLQEYKKIFFKLRLNLAWHFTGALIFPDFSWFVKLHILDKMVPQFAC